MVLLHSVIGQKTLTTPSADQMEKYDQSRPVHSRFKQFAVWVLIG